MERLVGAEPVVAMGVRAEGRVRRHVHEPAHARSSRGVEDVLRSSGIDGEELRRASGMDHAGGVDHVHGAGRPIEQVIEVGGARDVAHHDVHPAQCAERGGGGVVVLHECPHDVPGAARIAGGAVAEMAHERLAEPPTGARHHRRRRAGRADHAWVLLCER